MSKYIVGLAALFLFLNSCSLNEDNKVDTHSIKGTIIDNLTNEPLSDVSVWISDPFCSYLVFLNTCDPLNHYLISDEKGVFEIDFERKCNANIQFALSDSLESIYGSRFRWLFSDKNQNDTLRIACNDENRLVSEPNNDYDLEIRLQPQIFLAFNFIENPSLDFDRISISHFDIAQDSIENLLGSYDISSFNDQFEIETFYTDGTIQLQSFSYNYLNDKVIEIDLEI